MIIYHWSALICTWSLFDLCLIYIDLRKICVDLQSIYNWFTSLYINLKRIWSIYDWFIYDFFWYNVTQSCQLATIVDSGQTEMSA
jgi:hypothetical protein